MPSLCFFQRENALRIELAMRAGRLRETYAGYFGFLKQERSQTTVAVI